MRCLGRELVIYINTRYQKAEAANLTVDIDRKIRWCILNNIPGLLDYARHSDLVNLVGFDDAKSDALVNFIVFRTLSKTKW